MLSMQNSRALSKLKWKKIAVIGGLLATGLIGVGLALFSRAETGTIVFDTFDGPDGVITSPDFYQSANYPAGGTSKSTNPSQNWEGDSGKFYRQGNWGYSGKPSEWGNRWFFRYNTRNFNIGDAAVSWQYKSAQVGEGGYPAEGSDAVDVWLRYQTQYNLYVLQFDRSNQAFIVKRKIPGEGWSGPSNLIANKGIYYSLPTDAQQPIFGAGAYQVSWNGVQSLLPSGERSKPGFPNLARDSKTIYDFKATVKNLDGGKVQIQLYRAGVLVYSATDDGKSGIAANGQTQGQHVTAGYFNSVPGWQTDWGKPITKAGASGFRSDNMQFWLNDFRVTSLGTTTTPPTDTTKPTVSLSTPESGAVVSGSAVNVTAAASDNVGVSKVEFYRGTSLISSDTSAPYTIAWDTTPYQTADVTLMAKAYDAAGNVADSSPVAVKVDNRVATPPSDTQAPAVPTGLKTTFRTTSSIGLSWNASTDNVGVAYYKIYRYGRPAATLSTQQTSFLDTGLGTFRLYYYTVSAVDAAGNESAQSPAIQTLTRKAETTTSTSGVTVTATTTSNWTNGYCGSVVVKNTGSTTLTSWKASFNTTGTISSLWNAKWSQSGSTVTVTNESWNGKLAPGQTITDAGFCAFK